MTNDKRAPRRNVHFSPASIDFISDTSGDSFSGRVNTIVERYAHMTRNTGSHIRLTPAQFNELDQSISALTLAPVDALIASLTLALHALGHDTADLEPIDFILLADKLEARRLRRSTR